MELQIQGVGYEPAIWKTDKVMDENGALRSIKEIGLREWRERYGYSQETLMAELGIRSRQTISTWENADNGDLPRMVRLSMIALAMFPGCRRVAGKQANAAQNKKMKQAPGFRRQDGQ